MHLVGLIYLKISEVVMIIYWLLTQWNSFIHFRHIAILVSHKFYTV